MRKTKFIITLLMAVLMTFSSAFCVSVSAASSPDEAVISGNYDGIEPIPTEKPEDKPVKHGKGFSSEDYALFYTQTTFLALLAGYLIIFKVKGTKTKERCRVLGRQHAKAVGAVSTGKAAGSDCHQRAVSG